MISLCMIAKNAEKNIPKAINSVKKIVDEIIVVDTGSKDKTKDIAKSLGAKVYGFKWNDDFSKARNFALSRCTKEWILVLDTDEMIAEKDLDKIKELVKKKNIACRFIQRTYLNKKSRFKWNQNDNSYSEGNGYLGWKYRGIVRLFRNLPEIRFVYPIHETVKPSVLRLGKIVNSNIPIHHFSSNKDYLELLKKKADKYKDANSFAELAVHLYEIGRNEEAIVFAEKANKLNPKINLISSQSS